MKYYGILVREEKTCLLLLRNDEYEWVAKSIAQIRNNGEVWVSSKYHYFSGKG